MFSAEKQRTSKSSSKKNNKVNKKATANAASRSERNRNRNKKKKVADKVKVLVDLTRSTYNCLEQATYMVVQVIGRILDTVNNFLISVRERQAPGQPLGELSCSSNSDSYNSGAMVKKRQTDKRESASSTESGEEELLNGHHHHLHSGGGSSSNATVCQHIKKSVDTARLRRQLKTTGLLFECGQCPKPDANNASIGGDATECEYDNTLWLCLKCGTQLCGRAHNQHALQHHQKPHSDSHALALNTRSFKIWCYNCDSEVNAKSRKNLLECVELVKRLAQKPPKVVAAAASAAAESLPGPESESVTVPPAMINDIAYKIQTMLQQISPMVPMTGGQPMLSTVNGGGKAIPLPPPLPPPPPQALAVPGMAKRVTTATAATSTATSQHNSPQLSASTQLDRLPRVRGLINLGNTCFFNAVMQCLAQTPFLLAVLKELAEPGEEFELPGGKFSFKGKGDIELPTIRGTLSSWGNLTAALANALEELQSGGGVYTPSKLFDKLCAKCPQFTGGDQHDAHELLRQLLESVRAEDLKRYQRVILQNLDYKDQDINSVSEELRQKCKIYGNQAADRILRPEQVFRGFLVSTLTCQDCFNVSSRHEYFLDMSLPVAVEKPQPPQRRKTSPEHSPPTCSKFSNSYNNNKSSGSGMNHIAANFSNGDMDVVFPEHLSFYLHADDQDHMGPSKAQVKKEKERERKAKRAAKHQRTKLAQKLPIKLNFNEQRNNEASSSSSSNSGAGDHRHANDAQQQQQQSGSGDGQVQAPLSSADTDGDKARPAPWGGGQRADTLSLSSTTSEHTDADVEDNVAEDSAGPGRGAKFYKDSNGNAQPLGEKHGHGHGHIEHMDKDSLEEDENDSGIATSPAPTTTTSTTSNSNSSAISSISNNKASKNPASSLSVAQINADVAATAAAATPVDKDNDNDGSTATSLVNAGLSEEGASLIRQLSAGQLQLQLQMEQLTLHEQAKSVACSKRVRTQSYSDWSTTIAPRYQCEVGECSVPSCLNNFSAVELMTGQNKVGCESCTRRINGTDPKAKSVNTNATKQLLISSPPAVLILHLKRFQLGPRCVFRKLTRPVTYTMLLDIAAFCGSKVKNLPNIDRKQKKLLYALYGVVEHSGGLYGGHYTAYVKVRPKVTPDDKRWKFLPHGSKAELDQDDEQLKKLEESLIKSKAREMRRKAMDDSDDFTSSSSNTSTSDEALPDLLQNGINDDEDAPTTATATATGTATGTATATDAADADAAAAGDEAPGEPDEAANVQAPPGKWYYVSDSRVQEVNEEAALKAQAYLLFYERIY